MMHSPGFPLRKISHIGGLYFALALVSGSVQAEIKLLGSARLSGESTDLSGLTELLSGEIPHNRLGGISAIDYTGANDEYLLLPDRGPSDGATAYSCRVHRLHLSVAPGKSPVVTATIKATTMLVNEDGHALTGSAKAFQGSVPALWERFDPEGIRVTSGGSFFLSDEYGPSVFQFSPAGKRTAVFKIPQKFLVQHPSAKAEEEATNRSGRQPNGGMEGLAITPNGTKLYAAMQRPLIQDSRPDETLPGKRIGTNTRLLEIDVATRTTRELLYPLDATANGISEILAINDHEFLMLERDSKPGTEAIAKRIYKIDVAGATDISQMETLTVGGIPEGVTAVRKTLFLDLLDPKFGLAGPEFPEKVEGLAFGPDLPDGRRLLIVAIDNDFVAAKPIILHAFALDGSDLQVLRDSKNGGS
jgi:hypothetical protein